MTTMNRSLLFGFATLILVAVVQCGYTAATTCMQGNPKFTLVMEYNCGLNQYNGEYFISIKDNSDPNWPVMGLYGCGKDSTCMKCSLRDTQRLDVCDTPNNFYGIAFQNTFSETPFNNDDLMQNQNYIKVADPKGLTYELYTSGECVWGTSYTCQSSTSYVKKVFKDKKCMGVHEEETFLVHDCNKASSDENCVRCN